MGDGNGAVIASLLGKASMPFPGSDVVDSKPTPLIKTHLLPQSPTKNVRAT
jgi:hypothetical protein